MIEIINIFKQNQTKDFIISPENDSSFKQLKLKNWPSALHYEFLESKDSINIEIHLESDKLKHLSELLKEYANKLKDYQEFKQANNISWDPLWFQNKRSGGAGRLIISFPKNTFPSVISNAMLKYYILSFPHMEASPDNTKHIL